MRNCRFAAGDQLGIGRYLLEQVALACAARAKLDKVVIAFDECDHPQQGNALCPLVEFIRLKADRTQQEIDPVARTFKFRAPVIQSIQYIGTGHLDWPKRFDPERPTVLLLPIMLSYVSVTSA
jgi:hypothetical protein